MDEVRKFIIVDMGWRSKSDMSCFLVMEIIDDEPVRFYMARRPLKIAEHYEKFQYYNEIYN